MNLKTEPVVVITGAAGNLGQAVARAFELAGARTALVDRSPDRLRELFPRLASSGSHLLIGDIDMTSADSTAALARKVADHFGRIDVLVNTVGGFRGGKPVDEDDLANWDFLINLNLKTTLLACRAVIPQMRRQRRGTIINVSSRDGLKGGGGYAAYCATKGAVIRLTESLSEELKSENINVNCVLPGTIDTPQNRKAFPNWDYTKWVDPAALADVILFLASDAARAITGAAIPVYGKS